MLTPAQKLLQFGQFVLNPNMASLTCAGEVVPLRPKSFDVLLYLARNPGRVVSKDELMQFVWPNVFVTDNSLVQCISDIRLSLADEAQAILRTVARRGYLFAADVIERDEAPVLNPAPLSGQGRAASQTYPKKRLLYAGALVAGLAFLMAAGAAWWWSARPAVDGAASLAPGSARENEARSERVSIAVLPFVMLGGSPADDYFAVGLTEDIIAALGRFSELTVLSPNAVMPYKVKNISPEKIGRELNARYIASGSVRRSQERIRVAVQLTDTADGRLLWADQYDREQAGIFAIQDDITRRIAGALAVRMTNVEEARAAVKPPGKLEAYDLVLRGRDLLSRLNRSATSQARLMFERAVALDPNYAPAYVGLGRADLYAVGLGWTPDPSGVLRRAKDDASKAIAIDEFMPNAHALLGRIYTRLGEYDRAVDSLKRAMALNPSDLENYAGLGDALLWSGDVAGAIKALETAVQMDPKLSSEDLFDLGAGYFLARDDARAAQVFERTVARNDANAFTYAMLAAIYQDAGRHDEARRALADTHRLNPFFNMERFGSLFRNPEHRMKIISALRQVAP
jgi:TolB-like protein/DNA-binding winged helix-turn-helix (wHTH) protein/Tfp pilus assembly protein PilF